MWVSWGPFARDELDVRRRPGPKHHPVRHPHRLRARAPQLTQRRLLDLEPACHDPVGAAALNRRPIDQQRPQIRVHELHAPEVNRGAGLLQEKATRP